MNNFLFILTKFLVVAVLTKHLALLQAYDTQIGISPIVPMPTQSDTGTGYNKMRLWTQRLILGYGFHYEFLHLRLFSKGFLLKFRVLCDLT